MAPKKTNKIDKVEEPLQAVLLADSFASRFRPISLEKPKALLPLCNVPLIEYTLEFLSSSGVREVWILCYSHGDQIEEYISTRDCRRNLGLTIHTRTLVNCFSSCDVLRIVADLGIIKSDPFIIISSDVVSNVSLKPVIEAHKERTRKDARNMMTLVMKSAHFDHRSRSVDDDNIVIMYEHANDFGSEILSYNDVRGDNCVMVDSSFFLGGGEGAAFDAHTQISVRYDLMDCFIDICSPSILSLVGDEFDWRDLRRDLVSGILSSNVLGYKVFSHVIQDEYAARINDFKTYDAVSKDIIRRWVYPIVIDNNITKESTLKYRNRNIYMESASLSNSAIIGANTIVSNSCTVGKSSCISSSVIGNHCSIGNNVIIKDSYVWGNVIIEDGVFIDRAIICDGVRIGTGAIVSKGCVISFNVQIDEHVEVPEYTKITLHPETREESCDDGNWDLSKSKFESNVSSKCTRFGNARMYNDLPMALKLLRLEEDEDVELIDKQKLLSLISFAPLGTLQDFEEPFEMTDMVADEGVVDVPNNRLSGPLDFVTFVMEISATMQRFPMVESTDKETIHIEVSALKHSYNASLREYSAAFFLSIFKTITRDSDTVHLSNDLILSLKKHQMWWHFLLEKFVSSPDDTENETNENEILLGLVISCRSRSRLYFPFFLQSLQWLYLDDIVSNDSILEWAKTASSSQDTQIFSDAAHGFIEVLANEESTEEETSDEE